MRLHIRHETFYAYETPLSYSVQRLYLTPTTGVINPPRTYSAGEKSPSRSNAVRGRAKDTAATSAPTAANARARTAARRS